MGQDDVYTIKEKVAPDGYSKFDGIIKVTVVKKEENGTYLVDTENSTFEVIDEEGKKYDPEDIGITVEATTTKVTVKVENAEIIDLALRKFITGVSADETIEDGEYLSEDKTADSEFTRAPQVDTSKLKAGTATTAIYNHTKTPVEVNINDYVLYTIRVYNEGAHDAFAGKITDYLPTYLDYVTCEYNTNNGWSVAEDGKTITTEKLSQANGEENVIKAYNKTTDKLSYKDISIICKVNANIPSGQNATNIAEIARYENSKGKEVQEDRDSKENSLTDEDTGKDNMPTEEEKPNYNGGTNEDKTDEYIPGQEDDDDFEKIVVNLSGRYTLDIVKTDEKGNTITNLTTEFDVNGETKTTTNGIVEFANNEINSENLNQEDEYIIKETVAPDGYSEFDGTITLLVAKKQFGNEYVVDVENTKLEVTDKDGNVLDGGDIAVTMEATTTKITVKVENEKNPGSYSLDIVKTDEAGKTITDLETTFDINGQEYKTVDGVVQYGEKEINDENLSQKDEYTIKETIAPDEYSKFDGIIKVVVAKKEENGKYVIDTENSTFEVTDEDGKKYDSEDIGITVEATTTKVTVKVENEEIIDLALRKFITAIGNDSKTDKLVDKDGNYIREPQVDVTKLASKEATTATYTHPKEPVKVANGNTVEYTLRIYNEGKFNAIATLVTDYILENSGLEYLPKDTTNQKYGWKMYKEAGEQDTEYITYNGKNYVQTENVEEAKLIATDYLKDTVIDGFDGENLDYVDLKVAYKVTATNGNKNTLVNIAEIADDSDENGNDVTDRDSVPGEDEKDYPNKGYDTEDHEDDIDYEPVVLKEFDLALRKFITKVEDEEITSRIPELKYEDGKIVYEHPKTVVKLGVGDTVVYTLRVFNEGEIAGFAEKITDDIPEYLEYLPDNEMNTEYKWVMYDEAGSETQDVEEAVRITTEYASKANGELLMESKDLEENPNLLKAFDSNQDLSDENPDYIDVKVAFKVKDPNSSSLIIVNKAQISEDADENGNTVDDKDSVPDEWNDVEDDQDYENVKVQYFDLSLLKYVSDVRVTEDGKERITQTGNIGDENDIIPKVEVNRKKINTTIVKFGYTIKITNEGDIAGYAKEITDYVPEGLKFYAEDNSGWTDEGNNVISTRLLEDTLLNPGESATVTVVFRWQNSDNNLGLKTNIAEISEDENDKGIPDRDSTPDNRKDGEDDIDSADVLLSISTGLFSHIMMYVAIGGVILLVFAGGIVLIKRYVI